MGRDNRESTDRLIFEIPLNTNLDKVLRLFIATLGGGLHAIALALSTPHDNSADVQKQIDKLRAEIRIEAAALEDAAKTQVIRRDTSDSSESR